MKNNSKDDPNMNINQYKNTGRSEILDSTVRKPAASEKKEIDGFSNKIAFLNNFAMFESASMFKEEQDNKSSNNCKPSELKDFHKAKLENICMNKVRDQVKCKDNPNRSFLNHEFPKNSKTGEYQISMGTVDQFRKETRFENIGDSKVKMMIQRFESINSDAVSFINKNRSNDSNSFK